MRPPPPLFGLVLAGGLSRRMGEDKSALVYHGADQRTRCRGLLEPLCEAVFVSRRREQEGLSAGPAVILDRPGLEGPAAGMLSAHDRFPGAAWLVLACDMPAVDERLAALLLSRRDPASDAAAFRAPDGRPQPLFAVWEPGGLRALSRDAARGEPSPRRTLERARCVLLEPPEPARLAGIDTPRQRRAYLRSQ